MKAVQRITMVLSCIFFVVTLLFITVSAGVYTYSVLSCFLLHSLFLIGFAYASYNIRGSSVDLKRLKDDLDKAGENLELVKAENEEKLLAKEHELSEKNDTILSLNSELEALKLNISALEEKNTRLAEENENMEPAYTSLLPPIDEDEEKTTIDVIEAAQSVIDELEESGKKSGLSMRISSTEEKLIISADPNRIRILFRNIVDNSIKYMNHPGSLVITISNIDDDIFIVLKDTGEGLSVRETKHIFELNYQGSNRISGNGLGLTQAKAIVEYYGGTIYAKSKLGSGMGIYIQLPATISGGDPDSEGLEEAATEAATEDNK